MQTPTLPIQVNTAGPAPKNARSKNGAKDDGAQFSQTLSREMDQHKSPMIPPPAPVQAKPAAPAKAPQQAKPAEKAPAAKTALAEPARKAPAKSEGAEGSADGTVSAAAAAAEAAQAATAPMVDMLALVASFNQPAAAVAGAPADAASGDPLLGAGGGRAVIETPLDVAVDIGQDAKNVITGQPMPAPGPPLATGKDAIGATADKSFANLMSRTERGMPTGLKGAKAEVGQDSALPLERAAPQAGLERAAARSSDSAAAAPELIKAMPDPSQAVTRRARDMTAETPALTDLKVGGLASAPLQQAALGVAQAVNGAGGDKIPARVGTPAWDNQVAQKIVWMVAGEEQSASLTLNPPDLGPMQVVLSVTNDMASVTFTSAQPEVRQALEDAMPKLREMMSENGIALGNATVNDGSTGQRADGEPARHGGGSQRADSGGTINGSASDAAAKAAARPVRAGAAPGLVDTFA